MPDLTFSKLPNLPTAVGVCTITRKQGGGEVLTPKNDRMSVGKCNGLSHAALPLSGTSIGS